MNAYVTGCCYVFFNDTATTEIYTLSLHDALPIFKHANLILVPCRRKHEEEQGGSQTDEGRGAEASSRRPRRSEEHTSELQSRQYLVCRLPLDKKKIS